MSPSPIRYGDTLIFPASLDPDAVTVVNRLNDAGLESYFVGGCVRDLLVGLLPKDFDVSTAARPRQIRRLFRNSRIIGRRFKLAHVHFGPSVIEVATFRKPPEGTGEGDDTDLLIRRDNVFGTAEEDVVRRDFTINALLYDLRTSEVIDYVGGVEDLRQRVLRTIGDPAVRFAEDPVRMLRAVKFLSRLGMQPSPETDAAMHDCADLIERSAPPRVLEEIYKLMTCGKAVRALALFREYGLLERLLPEIAPTSLAQPKELAAMGAALDRIDRGRRELDNAFLLACLFLPAWRERLGGRPGQDPVAVIRDLITPAATRMSMPRRDVALVKQMLHAFARFEQPLHSRRFRMKEFLSRSSSRRALDLLYVAALAGIVDPELHAEWAHRSAEGRGGAKPAAETGQRDTLPRSRNRTGPRRSRSRSRRPTAVASRPGPDDSGTQSEDRVATDAAADGAEARPSSERSARRRRGRRGGRKRRVARDARPDPSTSDRGTREAAPDDAAHPTEAGSGSPPQTKPHTPARKSGGSTRRRSGSRRTRKVATPDKRRAQPARSRKAAKPDSDEGPGQRHPEDIEDVFDW